MYFPNASKTGFALEPEERNYKEKILIDRHTQAFIYERYQNDDNVQQTKITSEDVESLLNAIGFGLLICIKGDPEDVVENEFDKKEYTFSILTRQGHNIKVQRSFDKNNLPVVWPAIARTIQSFMNGPCDLFKEEYYEKAKRRESDQLFCNVVFEEGEKSYCYFLND